MYEEVDERYQAKGILMLQNRTLRIKEQFYRHLLAAFPGRSKFHSKGSNFTRKDSPSQVGAKATWRSAHR